MPSKKVLLINDLPCYGKVALAAMVPILSCMGYEVYQLPTAILSDTLDYGRFEYADMTDYMRGALKAWYDLGFDPDCIATGFISNEDQVRIITGYLASLDKDKKRLIMVDPIMGDGGKLYNGIGPKRVASMSALAAYSDICIPNLTEAEFITGIGLETNSSDSPGKDSVMEKEVQKILKALHKISGKSVVVTGITDAESREHSVCGYDSMNDESFKITYEALPQKIDGAGDIFSAILLGYQLSGETLQKSTESAVNALSQMIRSNEGKFESGKYLPVERCFDILTR